MEEQILDEMQLVFSSPPAMIMMLLLMNMVNSNTILDLSSNNLPNGCYHHISCVIMFNAILCEEFNSSSIISHNIFIYAKEMLRNQVEVYPLFINRTRECAQVGALERLAQSNQAM